MFDQLQQTHQRAMPGLLTISELQVNSTIFGWLFAVEVLNRKTSTGKSFLDLRLRDQRGNEIIARYFDPPRLETLIPQEGKAVLLEGFVEEYRSQTQIKLVRAETDEAVPIDLFMQETRSPLAQLEADFQHLVDKVGHAGLSSLLHCCFSPALLARFRRWPAAVRHHGAVRGGLLEHTVNVTTIAEQIAHLYPCNRDLVVAGALLHDIGKLEELEEQMGTGFTPSGCMVGHIVLGMQYVREQAQRVVTLDETTRDDLLHIILAHHTKEFGSPVNPATIEALIVHQADMAEAHLTEFLEQCRRSPGPNGWTTYSHQHGGKIRIP